jgi:UTP pyrophosphatase
MHPKPPPNYLAGYPAAMVEQVKQLIDQERLGDVLLRKYPIAHDVRTDKALYDYAQELKNEHLRNAGQLNKVMFDSTMHVIRNALGTHTSISRVQGTRLKSKREIRVATIFKVVPPEFYQLCQHMEPDYHQFEFDLRAYLSLLEVSGKPLWSVPVAG